MERNQMIAIVVIVIVIAGAGVAFVFMSQPTRPPDDIYVYETIGNPRYFDPHISYDSGSGEIIDQSYETLYTYPWGTGERGGHPEVNPTVPLLAADDPEILDNGTRYVITLRQGVTFADGTPFNASVAVWNFKRAMKMFRLAGPVWMIAEPIKGGIAVEDAAFGYGPTSPEFIAAFDAWDASDAVEATGTYEVTYRLDAPAAYFIPAMTYTVGCMISPTYAEAHSTTAGAKYGVDYGEEFTWMYNHTMGTGPYQSAEWRTGEFVKLVLNEDYWRADATEAAIAPPSYAGSIKEIWRRTNEDQTSMNLNLKTGIVDDTYWPTTHADEIYDNVTLGSNDENIYFRTGGTAFVVMAFSFQMSLMNWTLGTNTFETISPFAWRGLRKTFANVFDFDAFINAVTRGWSYKAQGPIPAGMPYQNATYWTEGLHPEDAVVFWNEAMNDSEFVDVMNTVENKLLLYYNSGNTLREQACLLLKDGFDAMMALPAANTTGLDATPEIVVNALEWANFLEKEENGELPIWLVGWGADYADPDNFVSPYLHSRGTFSQNQGYNSSVMDALILEGKLETDPVERQRIYNEIQELAAYDQPSLYLYSGKEFTTFRAWLKGIGMRYNTMPSYYYIYHVYKDYVNYT
ncbi:MAG: ABC transporter substrate-binding protein [Candidatus Thorarchaeota archaeon]